MGRCPGALGESPSNRPAPILALGIAIFVCVSSIAGEQNSPALLVVPEKIELEAKRLTAFDDDTVSAEGSICLRAGTHLVTARRALFQLKEKRLSLDSPVLWGLGYGIVWAARADFLAEGGVFLAAPVFFHTLYLEAEAARCDRQGCRIETAHVLLCPGCSGDAGLALSANRVVIHPSRDLDLYDPAVLVGGKTIFSLPFLRLRPDDRPGLIPPLFGASPTGGLLLGLGGRVPLGSSSTAEGTLIARSKDGFQSRTVLASPQGKVDLAHLSLLPPRQHALAFQGEGRVNLARAELALELDGTSSAASLNELYREPQERVLGPRSSIATLRFPGALSQLETSARLLQRLDGPEDRFGRAGAAALVFSLPAHPVVFHTIFLDARASLWRHFDAHLLGEGGWNRTVTTVEAEAFVPFRLGIVRGGAEVTGTGAAAFLDRSQLTGRMAASRFRLNLELPLSKKTTNDSRYIVPFIRYDLFPFKWSSVSFPAGSSIDPAPGRLSCGLWGSLLRARRIERRDARLAVSSESSRLSGAPRLSYAHLRLSTTGSEAFSATAQTAYDLVANTPSLVAGHLSLFFDVETVLELGAGYFSDHRGPHTRPDWTHVLPAQGLFSPIRLATHPHAEISKRLRFSPTRDWSAHFLSRNQVWPRFSFLVVGYGLDWRPRCGCIAVSLDALHRPDAALPDVMASLKLTMY